MDVVVQPIARARGVDAGLQSETVAGDQGLPNGHSEIGPLFVIELVRQGHLELAGHDRVFAVLRRLGFRPELGRDEGPCRRIPGSKAFGRHHSTAAAVVVALASEVIDK
ncbi:hypothetical protein XPR_0968 [Xanthomonas arboricola pv. pruni MAFF 301420]|uniref:Uncharacterized protein n=1 Tax=Xanthomonas arboricola pv. pruni MAFF 301420 TaxID=1418095 RepID=W4SDS0_9XANT|nr:hypothetical protein XPR_0968 [Xanthomonas arboricola pv. pruni MAFF 301420]